APRLRRGGRPRPAPRRRSTITAVPMDHLHDVRYAIRTMRRAPAFTGVAVVSLALGIGANTAIFSLVNTLMLRTLPVREPGQLVELMRRFPGEPALNAFPWQLYEFLRDNNHVFSSVIATSGRTVAVRVAN